MWPLWIKIVESQHYHLFLSECQYLMSGLAVVVKCSETAETMDQALIFVPSSDSDLVIILDEIWVRASHDVLDL